jgi:sensor histidine kinase YesM
MSLFEKIVRFSTRRRVLSHILFWIMVFVVSVTSNRYFDHDKQVFNILVGESFYLFFSMVSTYFLAYFIVPKLLHSRNYYLVILYFLSGSYLICICCRTGVIYFLEPIIRTPPFRQESILEILTDIPKLVIHYFFQTFSTAWVFSFLKLVKDQYQIQNRALKLEKEKATSELHMLKAQLNPHFLFNTLNNIYSLSLVSSPVTSTSIARLSEILDYILYRCNGPFVPLSAEINLLQNYIGLEKLRYDEQLQVSFRHEMDHDGEIAPLILLSLVENAFKHGAEETINNPLIQIDLLLRQGNFHFRVANTFKEQSMPDNNDKIGLNNVRKQLDLLYPGNYIFRISREESTFAATLDINLNPIKAVNSEIHESKVPVSG